MRGGIIKMYYFQCFPSLVLDRVWEYSSHSENWLPQKTSKEGRDGKQLYLRFLRVRKQTQIGKLCMISYLFIKHHPWQWSLIHPSVVFAMNRYSDVMSRQYQKITSQQRRFCALEEAIFTVFGRSHNWWWGAFSCKGLPALVLKSFSLFHVLSAARVALWTLLTCYVYPAKPTQRSVLLLPQRWNWATIL